MRISGIRSAAVALAVAVTPKIAHACAMCGLSPGDHAGHAYNTSVLFMLAGPYVTFGLLCGIVYLAYRRSTRAANGPDNSSSDNN